MAHNLYQNTMAYTGEVPWHQLGVSFDQEFTTQQAIEAAQLGYTVTKEPVYRLLDNQPVEIEDKYVTVNNDNQEVLGLVGSRYEIVQNSDAFAFFDEIMQETGAKFQTAGALGVGERVWLMAKLPTSWEILAGDKVEQNLLLSNSHDGSSAVQVRFTPIRVVCQNTLTMALKGQHDIISLKHTDTVRDRLAQSAKILKDMKAYYEALGEKFQQLAAFRIDDEWMDEYMKQLFGEEPKVQELKTMTSHNLWQKKTDQFAARYIGGMGTEIPGVLKSAWGAVNAAVEWADYEFPTRKNTDKTMNILWGKGQEFKQKAFDAAMALVG